MRTVRRCVVLFDDRLLEHLRLGVRFGGVLVGAVEFEVDDLAELLCGLHADGLCSAVDGSRQMACQVMLELAEILSDLA